MSSDESPLWIAAKEARVVTTEQRQEKPSPTGELTGEGGVKGVSTPQAHESRWGRTVVSENQVIS